MTLFCQKLLHMLSPTLISQPSKFELGTSGRCKKSFLAIQYSIKPILMACKIQYDITKNIFILLYKLAILTIWALQL